MLSNILQKMCTRLLKYVLFKIVFVGAILEVFIMT